MTNSNEPPRRPARRQPTRRSTTPRTSVPSARDELERERELYSQHDPTASFMHERVQNKPAGQERGASSAFPAYAGAGNDHVAHSRVATNQPAKTNQGYTANGNMSNVSAWDQHASANASQRMPRVEGQRPNMQGSQRMPRVAMPQDANQHVGAGGLKLCECYGSTESCPHLAVPPEHCLEWNGNWSGVAFEGIEVKVVDEHGNEVPHGTQGEEISRGPHMFSGYLKNPEATAKDLNDDGWFFSGDLCIQDEEGRVKINGRKKEILIRGGINISANEVDNNLDGCPGVGAHATIGLPDDRLGERICTFIVQTGDVTPTLDSIAEYLDSIGVAKRLRPEHIEFIDAIPMTESGKVKRHQLADELDRRLKERAE